MSDGMKTATCTIKCTSVTKKVMKIEQHVLRSTPKEDERNTHSQFSHKLTHSQKNNENKTKSGMPKAPKQYILNNKWFG